MSDELRRLGSICMIAGACSAGAHLMFVDPVRTELAEIRASVESQRADASDRATDVPPIDALMKTLEAAKQEKETIDHLSEAARDTAGLFARIEQVAGEHNTRLLHLSPVRQGQLGKVADDVAIGYQISIESTYQDLVTFVDALQTDLGITRIDQIRIIPMVSDGESFVTATIQTTHFGVTVALKAKGPEEEAGAGS